jgi:hypothetical protein
LFSQYIYDYDGWDSISGRDRDISSPVHPNQLGAQQTSYPAGIEALSVG